MADGAVPRVREWADSPGASIAGAPLRSCGAGRLDSDAQLQVELAVPLSLSLLVKLGESRAALDAEARRAEAPTVSVNCR